MDWNIEEFLVTGISFLAFIWLVYRLVPKKKSSLRTKLTIEGKKQID